jgi:hypothetical protein
MLYALGPGVVTIIFADCVPDCTSVVSSDIAPDVGAVEETWVNQFVYPFSNHGLRTRLGPVVPVNERRYVPLLF